MRSSAAVNTHFVSLALWLILAAAALGLAACGDTPTQSLEPPTPGGPAYAAATAPGSSTVAGYFNGTAIPAGRTVWFNAYVWLNSRAPAAGTTLKFSGSTVRFTANGQNYDLSVPNAAITYSGSATKATTTYDATTK